MHLAGVGPGLLKEAFIPGQLWETLGHQGRMEAPHSFHMLVRILSFFIFN